ncbi:MAG: type II toxin-antitoxin system VapC family toxin [Gemmatimonadaceae bacterium]|nr:type II toxin-antitoxin system VapC family toxin [Gemmatimonadaceae bacterium]
MATGEAPAGASKTHTRSAPVAANATRETRYIESSALLAALLEGDPAARKAIRAPGRRVTSALTLAEANRAVIRARTTGRLSAAVERDAIRGLQTFARRCEIVAVSEEVLIRAGRPFPVEPIRTLDAIHIATAELLGEPPPLVTFITRDRRVAENARALGYTLA